MNLTCLKIGHISFSYFLGTRFIKIKINKKQRNFLHHSNTLATPTVTFIKLGTARSLHRPLPLMNLPWKSFPLSLYQRLLTTQVCNKLKLHLPLPRKIRHTFSEVHGMNLTCLKILKLKCHNNDSTHTPEHHSNIPHLLPVYLLPHPHKNSWNREMRGDLEEGTKGRNKKENAGLPRKHVHTNKS